MSSNNSEKKHIVSFIKRLNEKDFSKANKNLEQVIQEKIKKRIAIAAQKPLF